MPHPGLAGGAGPCSVPGLGVCRGNRGGSAPSPAVPHSRSCPIARVPHSRSCPIARVTELGLRPHSQNHHPFWSPPAASPPGTISPWGLADSPSPQFFGHDAAAQGCVAALGLVRALPAPGEPRLSRERREKSQSTKMFCMVVQGELGLFPAPVQAGHKESAPLCLPSGLENPVSHPSAGDTSQYPPPPAFLPPCTISSPRRAAEADPGCLHKHFIWLFAQKASNSGLRFLVFRVCEGPHSTRAGCSLGHYSGGQSSPPGPRQPPSQAARALRRSIDCTYIK